MDIKILIYLLFLPTAFSIVTFKIIVPKGTPSVVINNVPYEMNLQKYPVYKIKISQFNAPLTYYYTINYNNTDEPERGIEKESIRRRLDFNNDETLNEFFNRHITTKIHPLLPRAYKAYSNYVPSKLYDDTHVATIIIRGKEEEINGIHKNPTLKNEVNGIEVIYANPFTIKYFDDATINISGQSSVYGAKLSYLISNLKNESKELYKRTSIKLRSMYLDASYLREKIYTDLLNSAGVPTVQSKFARVFINDQEIGLFLLTDKITNSQFLRETLNDGEEFEEENPIFKADYYPPVAIGDLGYYGSDPDDKNYSIYEYKGESMETLDDDDQYKKDLEMKEKYLIPFLKEIQDYPKTKKLNMNIKMFLKFMALEFLAGADDNFWLKPGNFYILKNMAKDGEWLFLDNDFDMTFGYGTTNLNKTLSSSIDNYVYCNENTEISKARPILDNIRSIKKNEEYFKEVLIRLISTSFHYDAIFPRIDSLAELIRDDIIWDQDLIRVSGLKNAVDKKYRLEDFEYHVYNETKGCENLKNSIPIKCWIKNKILNTASQLGVECPNSPDRSLGDVETLTQASSSYNSTNSHYGSFLIFDNGSFSLHRTSFISLYILLFTICFTILFFLVD